MSCNTVIQRRSSVVITRPECGQSVIVHPTVSRTVVVSKPPAQNTVVLRGVRGLPGLDVELQKTATHIQWRVHKAGEPWADLVALSEITGPASFADAPSDGTPYARKDGAWAQAATAAQGAKADAALPKAGGTMTGAITFAGGQTWPTFNQSTTGNAATATKLATARTLTIGATGKTFNGGANVAWTLAEIGAASDAATSAALATKVDKVAGKGLSTEDYTTAEKTKLAGLTPAAGPTHGESAVTLTRTDGVLTSVSFTLDGKSGTTTLTRTGGVLTQVATTYDGKTRTETLTYTSGVLTSISATEA